MASSISSLSRPWQNDQDGPTPIISASRLHPQPAQYLDSKNEISSKIGYQWWTTEPPYWETTRVPQTNWPDWTDHTTERAQTHPALHALKAALPNLESAFPQIPGVDEMPPSIPDLQSALHDALLSIMPTLEKDGTCYKMCF